MFGTQLATVGIPHVAVSLLHNIIIASMCNALLTMSSLILIVSLDGYIPLFRSVISWMRFWSMLLGPSFIVSR